MSIPQQLQYTNVKAKGWYTKFKQWPIQPMSSNMYWGSSQIVRFLFSVNQGVVDPYRSHIQIQVQATQSMMPVGKLQVDNSAQSFFNQMVITSNNVQVERIAQYDTLAAYLTDMGFSEYVAQNRYWQGLGTQHNHVNSVNTSGSTSGYSITQILPQNQNSVGVAQFQLPGKYNPTRYIGGLTNGGVNSGWANSPNTTNGPNCTQHMSPSNYSTTNWLLNGTEPVWALNPSTILNTGRLMNIRHEYNPSVSLHNYIDSTTSVCTSSPDFSPSLPADLTQKGLPNNATYHPQYSKDITCFQQDITTWRGQSVPNTVGSFGYSKPMAKVYSHGANQPFISPTIPQCQLAYGKILTIPIPVPKRTFHIPILSTVLGVLIPPQQFILIPLIALNNTLIQLTLNPYAMFTSGCQDIHEFDVLGMENQQKRNFRISRMVYNLHIYEFPSQQINQFIQASLTKQITITGSCWGLASQYQIPNGQVVRNNWQVNSASQSLAQVVCLFLSNDYAKYSYCRKQFRLSNNIRSMQLKFNTDFYPPQPIVGNAGNPQTIDGTGNNQPFLQLLLLSNNYLFSTNHPNPRINPWNFALNGRPYNTGNTNSYFPQQLLTPATRAAYVWNQNSANMDTALGQSSFHENRCIGKAAFVYSFQPYAHSKQYMVGVDSRNSRPFDVLFDTYGQDYFPRDQTLYIYTRSNVIVTYGEEGIKFMKRTFYDKMVQMVIDQENVEYVQKQGITPTKRLEQLKRIMDTINFVEILSRQNTRSANR